MRDEFSRGSQTAQSLRRNLDETGILRQSFARPNAEYFFDKWGTRLMQIMMNSIRLLKCGTPGRPRYFAVVLAALALAASALAGTNVWTTGGPVGGNTVWTMAADPNNASTLYASILYGPLYKTTDGGATWSQLPLSVPSMNTIGAVTVDPTHSSVVYAAWYGIAKSTNGGATWSGFSNPAAYIGTIVVDPTNPSLVYAGGNGYGIYKSTNGGGTWNPANTGLTNNGVFAIVMAPGTPQTLYAATDGGGVFKSTDGAATWAPANSGLANLGTRGLTVDPATGTLYAATAGSGVYKSTDGAASWTAAGLAGGNLSEIFADSFGNLYATDYSSGLFTSPDGGTTWPSISAGLGGNDVNAIAPSPAASGALHVGTTNGGIFGTTNNGTTWTAQNLGLGSHLTVGSQAVDPASPSTLYAGGADGLYKSTDSGANWTKIAFSGSTVNSVIADASLSPTRLYTSVWGSGVNVSTDSGATWTNINHGAFLTNILCVGQDPANALILYAGTNGNGLFRSINGGTSWTDVSGGTGGLPSNQNYCCLAFDPNHSGTLYTGIQFSDAIYKTTDGGTTWAQVFSGSDFGVYSIAVAPYDSNTVYAASYGNTNGVVKTINGGNTWSPANTGFSCLGVYAVALDPVTSGTVYAGVGGCGFSTGVYKSIDGGASWTAINSGLSNTMVHAILVDPTNRARLLAGTEAGLFTMTQEGPVVTAITPASGPTSGATTVTLTGTSFTGAAAVSFGVEPATSFTVDSDTQITAVSPAHAPGVVDITVTSLAGTSATSAADQFTYTCPAVTLSPTTLPGGFAGASYSQTVTANGGDGPYTYQVSSGSLPTGLGLDTAAGAITGLLSAAGTFDFTVTATDASNCEGSQSYTVTVLTCPTITVSPNRLAPGVANTAYSPVAFTQTGGVGTATWTETGALPAGVTFTDNGNGTATLTGTPAGTGNFPISVTATDASGCTGSQAYSLVVADPPVPASAPGLTAAPATVCLGVPTLPLSITPELTVTDGSEVLGNLLISNVPAGATLSAGVDQGSGTWLLTPAQLTGLTITLPAGTLSFTLSVQASEAKQAVLLPQADAYVDSANPSSNYGTLGNLQVMTYRSTTWDSYLRFDLSSLPPGAVITDATFSIIFYNGFAYGGDGNHYLFFVPDDTWTETGITWNNRPAYTAPYLGYWWPWNDNTPRYWTFGVEVGPTVQTKFAGDQWASFCIHNGGGYSGFYYSREAGAADSPKLAVNHDPAFTTQPLTVTVTSLALSPASLPTGTMGAAYSPVVFSQTGGVGTVTWSESGALPAGMTFDAATATLSGTPTALGSYPITVTATDSNGCTGTQNYTLTVVCPAIVLSPATLPGGIVGTAYSQGVTATGGTAPYTYALTSGALPAGMVLTPATGGLSGTPSAAGTYTFTVTATDTFGCAGSRPYTLTILCPAITLSPATLPGGIVAVPYAQTVSAGGGTSPYTFAVTAGALPPGLTFNGATGAITGTPASGGSFSFTITATDAYGCQASLSYVLAIGLYDSSYRDDNGRSSVCLNSKTGDWQYTVLSGAGKGVYTGKGTVTKTTDRWTFRSVAGSPRLMLLTYYPRLFMATGSLGGTDFVSQLYDRTTKDDPFTCSPR